jgi:hypothetical protein
MTSIVQQCARAVLMVRPESFGFNPQTAASNVMQQRPTGPASHTRDLARAEHQQLARRVEAEGIRVCMSEDTVDPTKPDALFPNNWVSFHADGKVVLYPMCAENRRLERRREVVDRVKAELGFQVTEVIDLSGHEARGRFLEGTGSMVLDHVNRVAYACRSPRTDEELLHLWCKRLGYEPLLFDAQDPSGTAIYHTNVMLSIGTGFAVVGAAAISERDRARVRARLAASGREVIEIGHDGIAGFAGNILELRAPGNGPNDRRVLAMSEQARTALGAAAFARLGACVDAVVCAPVPTIEKVGGGGVRCMLAEVFVP